MMPPITNYDHCLRCQVLDKRLSLVDLDTAEVVADNRGNICVHIEFDEQWDGCGKTARFIYEGSWKDVVLNSDNECICPSEVIKKGRFYLGVYGADLKTTTPLAITVAPSILSESGEELPDDPTPGQYEQIMKLYASTTQAADEATQACWDAIEAVNEASKKLNDTKEELEEGGFITSIKEKNKGINLGFWVGSTEEYEALPTKPINCYVILTDDPTMDKVKQATSDTGWVDLTIGKDFEVYEGSSDYRPQYRKVGNVVTVRGVLTPAAPLEIDGPEDIYSLFSGLPEEARPLIPYMVLSIGTGLHEWQLLISTNGQGLLQRYGGCEYPNTITKGIWLPFNATYIAQ